MRGGGRQNDVDDVVLPAVKGGQDAGVLVSGGSTNAKTGANGAAVGQRPARQVTKEVLVEITSKGSVEDWSQVLKIRMPGIVDIQGQEDDG